MTAPMEVRYSPWASLFMDVADKLASALAHVLYVLLSHERSNMPLSRAKLDRIEIARRQKEINRRSIRGTGYFMDAHWQDYANRYLKTGDEELLKLLPEPRDQNRKEK